MIHGNLEGIRQSTLDELEKLYDAQFARPPWEEDGTERFTPYFGTIRIPLL